MSDNDTARLLAAVIANPDDDAVAMTYANHLTGQGDARGEFIEVQIKLTKRLNPARRRVAVDRERELLKQHRKQFSAAVVLAFKKHANWKFRRGFVDEVRCNDPLTPTLAKNLTELLKCEPIRRLGLSRCTVKQLEALITDGLVGRLLTLSLGGSLGVEAARLLADSQQLAALDKLFLTYCEVGDDGIIALAESPHMNCSQLSFGSNNVGDEAVVRLAASERMARCRALYLTSNNIGLDGLRALTDSPHLRGLKTLALNSNPLGDHVKLLLGADVFPNLSRLELCYVKANDTLRQQLHERWGARLHM